MEMIMKKVNAIRFTYHIKITIYNQSGLVVPLETNKKII